MEVLSELMIVSKLMPKIMKIVDMIPNDCPVPNRLYVTSFVPQKETHIVLELSDEVETEYFTAIMDEVVKEFEKFIKELVEKELEKKEGKKE